MEKWKPVVGYEGLYEVSELGRIRSLDRQVTDINGVVKTLKGRVLKQNAQPSGHMSVGLSANGVPATRLVHVMVLESHVGLKPHCHMECLHKDGNAKNNNVSNLRWGTSSENRMDAYDHGSRLHGQASHLAKYPLEVVLAVRSLKGLVSSQQAAFMIGVNRRYVSSVWSGEFRARELDAVNA